MSANNSTPPGEPALLLTVNEVARLLGISVRSVWRLASAGELPSPLSIGRSKRWERRSLEAFVQAKARPHSATAVAHG